MDTISLVELEQYVGALCDRIRDISSDICVLLVDDLSLFAECEMKKAFINNLEFVLVVLDNIFK